MREMLKVIEKCLIENFNYLVFQSAAYTHTDTHTDTHTHTDLTGPKRLNYATNFCKIPLKLFQNNKDSKVGWE